MLPNTTLHDDNVVAGLHNQNSVTIGVSMEAPAGAESLVHLVDRANISDVETLGATLAAPAGSESLARLSVINEVPDDETFGATERAPLQGTIANKQMATIRRKADSCLLAPVFGQCFLHQSPV